MNLFLLHRKKRKNAMLHCDQHIIKMPLELAQMLYTAIFVCLGSSQKRFEYELQTAPFTKSGSHRGYKPTHINHPVNKWVRKCTSNFLYTVDLGLNLCKEYSFRFGGKIHAVHSHLLWLQNHVPEQLLENTSSKHTKFVLAMPDKYKRRGSVIKSYRKFYRKKAKHLFKRSMRYTNRKTPKFIIN